MGGFLDPSFSASFSEQVASHLFGHRFAARCDDVSKVANRSGLQRSRQLRQDGNRDTRPCLFCIDSNYSVSDVLLAKACGIATAKASVKKNIEHNPLACSN